MADRRAHIVVGLGFGDEGKGTIVDALVRKTEADLVVRFNGGAQAGHNVVTPDGRHHCFSQFGAGTLVPGCRTFLSRYMIVHPLALVEEEKHLQEIGVTDAYKRLVIDSWCLVTTPLHQAMNRVRELARGARRHGSCGVGVGETVAYNIEFPEASLHMQHLGSKQIVRRKIGDMRDYFSERIRSDFDRTPEVAEQLDFVESRIVSDRIVERLCEFRHLVKLDGGIRFDGKKDIVFEGAQGILLDQDYGFHPYTTWSTCTTKNAHAVLGEAGWRDAKHTIGVHRAYSTRHGHGPFPTEDITTAFAFIDKHNVFNPWQHHLRTGWFDAVLARYAIEVDPYGIDSLAITNLDARKDNDDNWWKVCFQYRKPNGDAVKDLPVHWGPTLKDQEALGKEIMTYEPEYLFESSKHRHLDWITSQLGLPISIQSRGPSADDKEFCEVRTSAVVAARV